MGGGGSEAAAIGDAQEESVSRDLGADIEGGGSGCEIDPVLEGVLHELMEHHGGNRHAFR